MKLDINDIMKILPHRAPFLLVDIVEEIITEDRIVATKNITYNENFFAGHFPTEPVMPGVLIIEAIAQTAAILSLSCEKNKNKKVYIGEIKTCRFRYKVLPGNVLRMEVQLIKSRGNISEYHGSASVEGKVCVEVDFICAIG